MHRSFIVLVDIEKKSGFFYNCSMNYSRWKSTIVFILLILLESLILIAQDHPLRFKRLSLEQGLLQGRISCILQDKTGLLWFATNGGLVKYDGYRFVTYEKNPEDPTSITDNDVITIAEDPSGTLWIGTNNGLNRFNHGTESFYRYYNSEDRNKKSLKNSIYSIFPDKSGIIWLGTIDGLAKFNPLTESFKTHYFDKTLKENKVLCVIKSREGVMWLGTNSGLFSFDTTSETFLPHLNTAGTAYDLTRHMVWKLIEDNEKPGVLWIGSSRGLVKYDTRSRRVEHYQRYPNMTGQMKPMMMVSTLVKTNNGEIWIGTRYGLVRFQEKKKKLTQYRYNSLAPYSISSDLILSSYQDRSGVLWFGTVNKGLIKLDNASKIFQYYQSLPHSPNTLSSSLLSSFYEDKDGNIWIGTYEGGLNKFYPKSGKFKSFPYQPGNPRTISSFSISCVQGDLDGKIWVGSFGEGIYRFDPQSESVIAHYRRNNADESPYVDLITTIATERSGALWFGTMGAGLHSFDPNSETFKQYKNDPDDKKSLCNNNIHSILEDRQGALWLGTQQGVDKFLPLAGHFQHILPRSNSLDAQINYTVWHIHEDREGLFWIGTSDGLYKYNQTDKSLSVYREKDGLVENHVNGILEDNNGHLWLATENGLSRLNPRTGEFKNFDFRNGLLQNQFNFNAHLKLRNGNLCIGGVRGFNIFNPNDVKNNPYRPPIIITSFKILNKEAPLQIPLSELDHLTLSHHDYIFSFEFSALDYNAPENNRYAYKMENFDRDWVYRDASNRTASYSNLPPGDYVFRVKGTNNHGIWNQEGKAIHISVIPPVWETWWFRLVSLMIFAVLSYLVLHFFRRYLKLITFWKKKNHIGHYRIIEEIGSGGMGTVYRAKSITGDSKTVALKVMREEYIRDSRQKMRFLREAAIVDRLDHPNIVKIIERGELNERMFIAMEYLDGQLLSERINETKGIELKESVDIITQLALALSVIHSKSIVHRDLKPENVILMKAGTNQQYLKLLDFGLAWTQHLSHLTETGTLLGTLIYIPPEHIKGLGFSFEGDIYSLGVIFYQMLTGEKPFSGDSSAEIMRKILLTSPVEPQILVPKIPESLNSLIMHMLKKKPAERPTLEQILNTLGPIGEHSNTQPLKKKAVE
jgi:ligand-binding sensor domain-containing protein/tRNA A-37 threonylcarbamoyl transferase component Bud32